MTIRVIVAEDHPLMMDAIIHLLTKHEEIEVVATAAHGPALLPLVRKHLPDIVFVDLSMPDFDPVAAVKIIRREQPTARCIALTAENNPYYVHAMVDAGAWGYILKSDDLSMALHQAASEVYGGKLFFSPQVSAVLVKQQSQIMELSKREVQILGLVAIGYKNDRIAEKLGVSPHCVRHALSGAYMKLGIQESDPNINPRVVAIAKAQEMGLL